MGMNLFIYPHAPAPVQDSIDGFRDTTPFSADGIARHFTITDDPAKADLFWMGQHTEQKLWLLHPNRFPHFEQWPEKHVCDLEGDWYASPFPHWIKPALISTSNWNTDRMDDDWRIFPRVIMSPLLMRLVRDPPSFAPPKEKKLWFHGQRDPDGVREKVQVALEASGLPHDFRFNDQWLCYVDAADRRATDYVQAMRDNAFSLCIRGSGQNTCRFYETAAFGRLPIIISNHYGFGEPNDLIPPRIHEHDSAEAIASQLIGWYKHLGDSDMHLRCERMYEKYFKGQMLRYFADPTAYFLEWAKSK